ncbi:MAG: hypothetical protein IJA84_06540 [Clostridia bacterium]|nr:hypothetical protein [Clostridia bacterium]
MLVLALVLVLLISYGDSEPIVELRERIVSAWEELDYEEALETLGRSFSGETGEAAAVFGRQILGFGEE